MPILSAEVVDNKSYRITMTMGQNMIENLVVTDDGIYDIYYIKDGISINKTGRILNIVQNNCICQNSYILFDWSDDNSNRRERIYFYQVTHIKDITPNNAYKIAVDHGFVGTVEDWLESMRGDPGKSAYEVAVDCGFEGSEEDWLNSMRGDRGFSAYEVAKNNGFEGTEEEWLESIRGPQGKSAYELAVEHGFDGSEEDWIKSLQGEDGKSAYDIAKEHGFEGTEEEWITKISDVGALADRVDDVEETLEWKLDMVDGE